MKESRTDVESRIPLKEDTKPLANWRIQLKTHPNGRTQAVAILAKPKDEIEEGTVSRVDMGFLATTKKGYYVSHVHKRRRFYSNPIPAAYDKLYFGHLGKKLVETELKGKK